MNEWYYSYNLKHEKFECTSMEFPTELNSDEVKVKPLYVGICGSDLKQILLKTESPKIGHEWVGVIQSIGSSVTDYSIGEKVISLAHVCCERCSSCLSKDYSNCTNRGLLGGTYKSVLASSVIFKETDLLKVPQTLSLKAISLFEVAFIGYTAYERARSIGLKNSDHCLVFGAGPIGLFTALTLRYKGHKVTVVEVKQGRLQIARNLGFQALHYAEVIINRDFHSIFDVVFDCSGDNHGSGAISTLPVFPKENGIVIIVGKYSNVQLSEHIYSGKSLRITWVANHEKEVFIESIKFWTPYIEEYAEPLTKVYNMKDINTAFNNSMESENIKTLIKINPNESS